jgi:hypothetical protein
LSLQQDQKGQKQKKGWTTMIAAAALLYDTHSLNPLYKTDTDTIGSIASAATTNAGSIHTRGSEVA